MSNMQMKDWWELVEINPKAPLKLYDRWNKSGGGSTAAIRGMVQKTICMQLHPKERRQSHRILKVHIIVTGTTNWRVCTDKLKN